MSASTKLGNLLITHEEITKLIFNNLNTQELNKVSLVCHSWNNIATKIRKNRTKLQVKIKELSEENRNSFESNENYFKDCVNITGKPIFCLTFINQELYERYLEHLLKEKTEIHDSYKNSKVHYMLRKCIPNSCESFLVPCKVCISVQLKMFNCRFFRAPPPLHQVYIAVSFPEIPGVQIQSFESDCNNEKVLLTNIDFTNQIKCLIIFVKSNQSMQFVENFINNVKKQQKDSFILGIFTEYSTKSIEDDSTVKILIFSGNINASSIYYQEILNSNQKNEILKTELYNSSLYYKKDKSLAFMFAQNGKGDNIYNEDIVEFQKIFTNTDVVGMKCGFIYKKNLSDDGLMTDTPTVWPYRNDPIYQNYERTLSTQIILLSWN